MKKIIPIIIILVIIGGGVFYGGMKYGQSARQDFQSLSPEQRQQLFQGNIGESFQRGIGRGTGSNLLNGEVIDKDEQSLTLKIPDGGSKIVFLSDSTQISKTTETLLHDLSRRLALYPAG